MKMLLISGSPYARKVRIILRELEVECELNMLSTYPPTEDEVGCYNPSLRIPTLIDGKEEIFESDLIVEYVLETYGHRSGAHQAKVPFLPQRYKQETKWIDLKRSAIVETLIDTMVNAAYLNWCGLTETRRNLMGFSLESRWEQRIARCLDWLEEQATPDGFSPGFLTLQDIEFICAVEWTDARMQYPWREGRPTLAALVDSFADRPSFAESQFPPMPDFLMPALEEQGKTSSG